MKKQSGFGLPEILISLLLTSLIITALMNHYISIKHHYFRLQLAMDDAMEVQWAGELIRDSIRQAGFTPCLNVNYLITDNITALDVAADLKINRMSPRFNILLSNPHPSRLLLTRNTLIHEKRSIMIADCFHAEVRRVIEVVHATNGQMVILATPLTFVYQQPAYVGEWIHERFFIKPSRGLFYQRDRTDELTPLVTAMSSKLETNLVQIGLELKGGQEVKLETRIRGLS